MLKRFHLRILDLNLLTFPLCVPQSIGVCGKRKYHYFYREETLGWQPAEAVMIKPSMLVNIHIIILSPPSSMPPVCWSRESRKAECKHWLRLCVRRRELFAHETFLIRGRWFSDAAWKNRAISRQRHFAPLCAVKHHPYVPGPFPLLLNTIHPQRSKCSLFCCGKLSDTPEYHYYR